MGGLGVGIASTLASPGPSRALESDEFEETFGDGAIGIELEDVRKITRSVLLAALLWVFFYSIPRPRYGVHLWGLFCQWVWRIRSSGPFVPLLVFFLAI